MYDGNPILQIIFFHNFISLLKYLHLNNVRKE